MINIENKFEKYDFIEPLNEDINLEENILNQEVTIITQEYFKNQELNKETIYNLRENNLFRVRLLKNIQLRIENIIVNSSTLLFKELVIVINLLSLGKKYSIFERYNEFSSNEISKLFKDYEEILKQSFINNKDDFQLNFDYYMTLLKVFSELCVINSTDVKRKKSIKNIIELITESINTIKFSISLDEDKISKLSSFQSGLLINFSNILYISTENKTLNDIINKYEFIYNIQVDGYFLSQTASTEAKEQQEIDFLANSTELLLLLLRKYEKYQDKSFDKLINILDIYNEYGNIKKDKISSTKEFKDSLLNNLVYIYDNSLEINHTMLISYILNKDIFTSTNMQIIHNYILFSDNIQKEELEEVLSYVINLPKMQNDFHEYHKLKTIDIIINKLISMSCFETLKNFIPEIKKYLNHANTASQLLSVFSKIYLSLSYYYSLLGKEYLETSQEQYFIGEKICSFTLIKDEYNKIFKKIIFNNAKTYFDSLNITDKLNTKDLEKLGLTMMNDFLKNQEIITKYKVNDSIEKVIEEILKDKDHNQEKLEKHISHIISSEIFFGLAQCKIIRQNSDFSSFKEIGYEILEYPLINSYKILYKYSYSYKDSFNSIFKENETYIKNNVINLILSYLMRTNDKKLYDDYLDESLISYESLIHKF